jgi:hypothetical protein
MPFVYPEVEQLWHKPLAGSGTCVDIIKESPHRTPADKDTATTQAAKSGRNVYDAE